MQSRFDNPNGSFHSNHARLNLSQIRQRGDQADRPVSAHAEVADVIKEDDAELAGRVGGRDEVRADQHVRAARFEEYGAAQVVVTRSQRG